MSLKIGKIAGLRNRTEDEEIMQLYGEEEEEGRIRKDNETHFREKKRERSDASPS